MIAEIDLSTEQKQHIASAIDQLEAISNRALVEEITLNVLKSILPERLPRQTKLMANYPNPFNPTTKLRFDVADNSQVTMVVYNLMGQEVVQLLDNAFYEPGSYTMTWQALNKRGEQASAGMYLVRMTTSGGFTATRKMVLLK